MENASEIAETNRTTSAAVVAPPPGSTVAIFTGAAMVVQSLASLPVSCLIAYLVAARPCLRISVNYILVSGVLAEAFIVFNWAILNGFYVLVYQNETVCALAGYGFVIGVWLTFGSTALVAFNRYLILARGELYDRLFTQRNTLILLALLWISALIAAAPFHAYFKYDDITHMCGIETMSIPTQIKGLILANAVCTCGGAYTLLVLCNWKVWQQLSQHKRKMAAARVSSVILENGSFEGFMKLMLFYWIAPLVFWGPYGALKLFGRPSDETVWLGRSLQVFQNCYECSSPYAIIFFVRPFRVAVNEFFSRSGVNKVQPQHVVYQQRDRRMTVVSILSFRDRDSIQA